MKLFFTVICALVQYASGVGLEVIYQWKYLDWVWPNVPLTGSEFVFGNAFTQDVDVDRIGRVFVTSPRWLKGVPISLSTLSNLDGPGGPLLLPYPDWTWFVPNTCDSIISVYRVAVITFFLIFIHLFILFYFFCNLSNFLHLFVKIYLGTKGWKKVPKNLIKLKKFALNKTKKIKVIKLIRN